MNTKQTHTAQQNLLFLALLQAEYAKQKQANEELLNILLLVVHATRICQNDNCFSGMDASDENCREFANANSIAQTAGTPFERYEWGQRVYIKYGNGVETTYTYDENRRWLSHIRTTSPDFLNPVLQNISYEFNEVGNVKGYVNDAGNYRTAQTYHYDSLYQLTSANGESEYIHNGLSNYRANYSQAFTFDTQGLGNMLTKTSSASNNQGYRLGDELNYNLDYEYDAKFVHRAKRIGKQHYLYDLNGNLISEQEGAYSEVEESSQHEVIQSGNLYSVDYGWGIVNPDAAPTSTPNITRRNYTWNERNLLKTSTDRSYSVQYKYGADGQRSAKYSVGSNGVSETLYFNKMWNWRYDSRIMQREGRVSKHIYLGETRILTKLASADNDLNAIVSEELTKQYYYHTDHLGSAQLISDHDGKEYERIEYTPYGELWIEKKTAISQIDIPFRFTGKERDEETGLYYYGARYLDAKTSRWLSTDPALGDYIPQAPINDEAKKANGNLPGMGGVFNTVNSHLYHYAGNNPVKYTDPDGRADIQGWFNAFASGEVAKPKFWSDSLNKTFPTPTPNAENYAKADQSANPRTVDESLKAGYKPLSPYKAAWHRQGKGNEYNIKMVHPDGREAVYNKDGNLVFDSKNLGTKNAYSPDKPIEHIVSDVLPYFPAGNTPSDKPKGVLGSIVRGGSGIITNINTPKDYKQYWDRIYNPPPE